MLLTIALLMTVPAESPITPDASAIDRLAKRGTTAIEADVPDYTLPPLPRTASGEIDREEIVRTLREEMFGTVPNVAVTPSIGRAVPITLRDGTEAVHQTITLTVTGGAAGDAETSTLTIRPQLFRPAGEGPFPCFIFLDHRSQADDTPEDGPEATNYWDVPLLLRSGFATVAVRVDEVDPDDRTPNFDDGIHALVAGDRDPQWSTLAAWAWAMSQTRRAAQTIPEIGPCIAVGHSRGGKTALWAAASDDRFAGAVSNESGCGGATLSRRRLGETVRIINTTFPHWFAGRFKTYNDREGDLPHDQHWLIAAIAPRGAAVGSAAGDVWADPYGEWLALKAAAPAWGDDVADELGDDPTVDSARDAGPLHYHLRDGKHALLTSDWQRYIDWADRLLADDDAMPSGASASSATERERAD